MKTQEERTVNLKDFDTFFQAIALPTDIRADEDHPAINDMKKRCLLNKNDKKAIKEFEDSQKKLDVNIDFDIEIAFEVAKILHTFYQYENIKTQKVNIDEIINSSHSLLQVLKRHKGKLPNLYSNMNYLVIMLKRGDYSQIKDECLMTKQDTKYALMLFKYVMQRLDNANPKDYKTKDKKTSEELQKLVLSVILDRDTGDKKEKAPKLRRDNLKKMDISELENRIKNYKQLRESIEPKLPK